MNLFWLVVCAVLTVPIHELGHYIPSKLFGWKPEIKVVLKGFFVVHQPQNWTEAKMYVVSFLGIVGVAPFLLYASLFDRTAFFPCCFSGCVFWLGTD